MHPVVPATHGNAWSRHGLVPRVSAHAHWRVARLQVRVAANLTFVGVPLNTVTIGRDDGPTLVLVHGLGGSWQNWKPILGTLTERFRVVAVDLPGFGGSPRPYGRWTMHEAATAVAAAAARHARGPRLVCGHSLGGAVALQLAVDHPNEVDGMLLLSPAGVVAGQPRQLRRRHHAGHRMWRMFVRTNGSALLRSARLREQVLARVVHDPTVLDARSAAWLCGWVGHARSTLQARQEVIGTGLVDDLGRIGVPTRVVWGVEDRLLPLRTADVLEAELPGCVVTRLEQCGHLPHWERPAEVLAAAAELRELVLATTPPLRMPSQAVPEAAAPAAMR